MKTHVLRGGEQPQRVPPPPPRFADSSRRFEDEHVDACFHEPTADAQSGLAGANHNHPIPLNEISIRHAQSSCVNAHRPQAAHKIGDRISKAGSASFATSSSNSVRVTRPLARIASVSCS